MTHIEWRDKVQSRARIAARAQMASLFGGTSALANLYGDQIADAVVAAVSPVPSFWDAAMDRIEHERESLEKSDG